MTDGQSHAPTHRQLDRAAGALDLFTAVLAGSTFVIGPALAGADDGAPAMTGIERPATASEHEERHR